MKDRDVVERCAALVAEFGRGLSRPEQKFLQDLVFGILCSQSSLLSEISRAIAQGKNVRTVLKRLDFNLGRYDLKKPYERAQSHLLRRVDESYLFIFDPSEIVKPFAKKMEGLAKVRDASEKPRIVTTAIGKKVMVPVLKPGYPLRVAIAMSPTGDVLPIELSLYSCASEFFVSENDEYINALETLIHKTNFEPTLILDREFDAFVLIRHLCSLRQKFVIRVTANRKYREAGSVNKPATPTYERHEMIDKFSYLRAQAIITYTRQGQTQELLFSLKAAQVELLPEAKKGGDVRDRGDLEALTLVQVKIHKADGTPTLYLLTNSRPSNGADLERIARSYLARWNIEEYIRFLKQHFGLEGFLVRDLGRMKNLISAVYIATVVMHSLTNRASARGEKTHHRLVHRSLEVGSKKRFRDFFLYAYGRGLSRIALANKKLLNPRKVGFSQSGKNQMALSLPD